MKALKKLEGIKAKTWKVILSEGSLSPTDVSWLVANLELSWRVNVTLQQTIKELTRINDQEIESAIVELEEAVHAK